MDSLRRLEAPTMLALAEAIEAGRADAHRIIEIVSTKESISVLETLRRLGDSGMRAREVGAMLRALAGERSDAQAISDRFELVWSGEEEAAETRSTPVVVQHLFASARRSLLVASYALERGPGAAELFGALARRMDAEPALSVRFFLNIERRHGDDRPEEELLREFRHAFRERTWPGVRAPEIFYDPRALVLGPQRSCLHAKCIVADDEVAFVTSANFTEAAQERNLEAGVLLRDPRLSRALVKQFESLLQGGRLMTLAI
jgi:phosphatidylserine/phosphatidylglycerophosphate/cardiolipin synthase-like enzyme